MLEKIISDVIGKQPRKQQQEMYDNFNAAIANGMVGMVEASTGIGKTLAKLASAVNWLRMNAEGRVVISAPTKALVQQTYSDAKAIPFLSDDNLVTVIYSKNDFINVGQFRSFLKHESLDVQKLGNQWLKEQETSLTPYLASDLETLIPDFKLIKLCLLSESDTDESDQGYIAYKNQFTDLSEYRLLICTHAMFAYDLKIRRAKDIKQAREFKKIDKESISATMEKDGKTYSQSANSMVLDALDEAELKQNHFLPPYEIVFIDEGHLFERAVSMVLSPKCSFWVMERNLHALTVRSGKKKALSLLSYIMSVMNDVFFEFDGGNDVSFAELEKARPKLSRKAYLALNELQTAMTSLKVSKTEKNKKDYRQLTNHTKALDNFIFSAGRSGAAEINFSPEKRYASLRSLSQAPHTLLNYLYQTTQSVIFVSATLTFPEKPGRSVYERMANVLFIPKEKLMPFMPVLSDFMHKGVTFELKTDSKLMPVNIGVEDYETKMSLWGKSIAEEIEQAHSSSAGGTLVLNTSYQSIEYISKHLTSNSVIVAKNGYPLLSQKKDFLTLSQKGQKPIWLAIGGAWTGLDLSGKDLDIPAELDNVLTTEIITRLPIGLNRSLMNRDSGTGFNMFALTFEAYQVFRQGVGRLVRRENLRPNRKLIVLDPRLEKKDFLFQTLKKVIEPYISNEGKPKNANPLLKKKVVVIK